MTTRGVSSRCTKKIYSNYLSFFGKELFFCFQTMAYSCRCFNIRIKEFDRESDFIQNENTPTVWSTQSQHLSFTLPKLQLIEDFSSPALIVYQGSLQKASKVVNVKYTSLLIVETLGQWKSFTCSNCQTKTHLTYADAGQTSIIINRGRLADFEEQTRLKSEIACFGILCQKSCPTSNLDLKDLPGTCSSDLNNIQRLADLEIEKARSETALRIKIFCKQQEDQLRDVEQGIFAQRKALLNQIKIAQEAVRPQSGQVESLSSLQFGKNSLANTRNNSEEFTEHDMFYESSSSHSQDSDEFDDDELTPNYRSRNQDDSGVDVLAKSVPVNIGAIPRTHRPFSGDDEIPAPDKMAASMQALAKSVGVDSTEMFGDLPRQRASTYRYHN